MIRVFVLVLAAFCAQVAATDANAQRSYDTDILAETFGFDLEEGPVAYTESLLQEHRNFSHEHNGLVHGVTLHDDGFVSLEREGSEETFAPIRLYWFAWYTFHPRTELIQ